MAKLIYSCPVSLDGCVADENGDFDWAVPSEEVHAFINDLQRPVGTYLYGRRMYETMLGWETGPAPAARSAVTRDFADQWQAAEKIVYSTTLHRVCTGRTRLERTFDPDALRQRKAASDRDLTVGGPGLAAHAVRAGLVDEYQLFVVPTVVGGGKRFFPAGVRVGLDLLEERRFADGTVHLRYRAVH
ncbi:dihydrofolate reductase family protein [Streptomyces sulfonofaciens]|nr:dihydrofolate reductase family protein [Streptomyces sulfonofaciens]